MQDLPEWIDIGDEVTVEKELRTVTALRHNIRNEIVIVWKSKQAEGACITGLWREWQQNEAKYLKNKGLGK